MKARFAALVTTAGLLCAAPVMAHHSFAAEFDGQKPFRVTGALVKIEWTNPHTYFHVDVKAANGKVELWKFEGASPSALAQHGWKRSSVKIGDEVSIKAYQARDGSKVGSLRELTLADGKKLTAVDPKDGGPTS